MMRRSTAFVLAGAVIAAAPAAAAAQSTPPAAAPKLSITTERVSASGGRASVLVGQAWQVRVVLKPFVSGQTAVVRFYRNGRRVKAAQPPLVPSPTGKSAYAVLPFTSGRPGRVVVRATHFATPQVATLKAKGVGVSVVRPSARPGARGPVVRLLQARLAQRGYVVGRRGLYDARTARAVLAFRKVTGMRRTNVASADVFAKLARGAGRFRVRFPSHGKHVEADLSRQVIALIRNGRAERIYPASSASRRRRRSRATSACT